MWSVAFSQSVNQKVLLMLSGGKDSAACLHMLKKRNIDVTAVHFRHRWGWKISTMEARRLCKELSVFLHEIDFTEEFSQAVVGFTGGRPCLLCKPEMYKKVIALVRQEGFGWVCIGDNANDQTTINRLIKIEQSAGNTNLCCSSYFGNEQGIQLPEGVKVLRPLLTMTALEVESYLATHGLSIQRNHCTGDKYFEYAREGCPVQFHDPGHPITLEDMDKLLYYNSLVTTYARNNQIRAAVHLPSTFIVSIPEGHEEKIADMLADHSLIIKSEVNKPGFEGVHRYLLSLFCIDRAIISNSEVMLHLIRRFAERLGLPEGTGTKHLVSRGQVWSLDFLNGYIMVRTNEEMGIVFLDLVTEQQVDKKRLGYLVPEVFRTRNYRLAT